MSAPKTWTKPSPTRLRYRPKPAAPSLGWPQITAEQLHLVREPLRWRLELGQRVEAIRLDNLLRGAALGPRDVGWLPPEWLRPHQIDAARRVCGCLAVFRGALLADAVGLGKTYIGLRLLERALEAGGRALVIVPAALREQWARELGYLGATGIPATGHRATAHARADDNLDLWVREHGGGEIGLVSMESLGRGGFDPVAFGDEYADYIPGFNAFSQVGECKLRCHVSSSVCSRVRPTPRPPP